jgi:hypothetical protein
MLPALQQQLAAACSIAAAVCACSGCPWLPLASSIPPASFKFVAGFAAAVSGCLRLPFCLQQLIGRQSPVRQQPATPLRLYLAAQLRGPQPLLWLQNLQQYRLCVRLLCVVAAHKPSVVIVLTAAHKPCVVHVFGCGRLTQPAADRCPPLFLGLQQLISPQSCH